LRLTRRRETNVSDPLSDETELRLRPLPERVVAILRELDAPPRLVAHLRLVFDVASQLVDALEEHAPALTFDREEVLFGSATHDIGKTRFQHELVCSGSEHEAHGPALLTGLGVAARLARFTRTHAAWKSGEELPLEDLLVALADTCWKGKRSAVLESRVASAIAEQIGIPEWEAMLMLDSVVERLASDADERLAWQSIFPV
jgi:hypothetical protein